jgi:2',3'-cyclic-nucleotide 2'-phosphodiesterase (5'-nucleotidase family)
MILAPGGGSAPTLQKVNDTLVVSAGQYGTTVGKLLIVANVEGQILDYRGEVVTLDERVGEDVELLALMAQFE